MTNGYPIIIEGDTALVSSAAELVTALDVLQGHHDRVVLEQLRPHLAEIIGGPQGLLAVLRVLVPQDQGYLVGALGTDLAGVVQSAAALRDILATLAEAAVEERLLETLGGEGLRALIGSAEELAEVLEWIYGDCDQLVLRLLGAEFVQALCPSGYDLSLVLHSLGHAYQQELVATLGWQRIPTLVRDRRDLAYLLRALPGDLSQRLLSYFTKEQLTALIRTDRDWQYVYRRLEADEAAYLRQLLGRNDHA